MIERTSSNLSQILGLFDTFGPAVLAFPPSIAVRQLKDADPEIVFRENRTGNHKNLLPLSYEPGSRLLVTSNALQDAGTGVHECHHFMNVCSCPVGCFLHMNRGLEVSFFGDFLQSAVDGGWFEILQFPLITSTNMNLPKTAKEKLKDFIMIAQTCRTHTVAVGGLLSNPSSEREFFHDWNPLHSIYSTFFPQSKNLIGVLSAIKGPFMGPLIQIRGQASHGEMGACQIFEQIANFGEAVWLLSLANAMTGEVAASLVQASDKALKAPSGRYNLAQSLIATILDRDPGGVETMAICWASLLAPIAPTTIEFVEEYHLDWEDLHPGWRLWRIADIVRNRGIEVPDQVVDFQTGAGEFYDRLAAELRWPLFEQIKSSMASTSRLFRPFQNVPDPFLDIYKHINEMRSLCPGFDLFPRQSLVADDKQLYVPVLASRGELAIANGPLGMNGLFHFVAGNLSDFCINGGSLENVSMLLRHRDIVSDICRRLYKVPIDAILGRFSRG